MSRSYSESEYVYNKKVYCVHCGKVLQEFTDEPYEGSVWDCTCATRKLILKLEEEYSRAYDIEVDLLVQIDDAKNVTSEEVRRLRVTESLERLMKSTDTSREYLLNILGDEVE